MPALKHQLEATLAQLKRELTPDQITLVIRLIHAFIDADRRGVLTQAAQAEQEETV